MSRGCPKGCSYGFIKGSYNHHNLVGVIVPKDAIEAIGMGFGKRSFSVKESLQALPLGSYRLGVMLDELESIRKRVDVFQDWGED